MATPSQNQRKKHFHPPTLASINYPSNQLPDGIAFRDVSQSQWLPDTPGTLIPGVASSSPYYLPNHVTWETEDVPGFGARSLTEYERIKQIKEIFKSRYFAMLQIGDKAQLTTVGDAGYISIASLDSSGGPANLFWNVPSSYSIPKAPQILHGQAPNGRLPVQPRSSDLINTDATIYLNDRSHWTDTGGEAHAYLPP